MQVCAEWFSDTANSRKVSTGEIRPTVPNRSQKEDVLTSSNYLRSGLRKSFAFPIMLAAVGLLLASLVLGAGTNLARALGAAPDGATAGTGICDYSELMRDAILDNNAHKSYDCDKVGGTAAAAAAENTSHRGYTGNAITDSWGGVSPNNTSNSNADLPNDLDLSNMGLATFKPGVGELDGFIRGSRVDLRGNGLTVADIDLSDARKSNAATDDAYTLFGVSTEGDAVDAVANLGLTFLLDGGSESVNGLASANYEATENGILWLTFEYPSKGKLGNREATDTVAASTKEWLRVSIEVEHIARTNATDTGRAAETTSDVNVMIHSSDAPGTLYAVPFLIPSDSDINTNHPNGIEISFGNAGTFAEAVTTTAGTNAFTSVNFDDSLVRDSNERAKLAVAEDDIPAVAVRDRQRAVEGAIDGEVDGKTPRLISKPDLAGITRLALGAANSEVDNGDAISELNPDDLSGLTGLVNLDLSGNKLIDLPSGLFADVGSNSDADLSTRIDLTGDEQGPTGDGFTLANLGPAGNELIGGQFLVLDADSDAGIGFQDASLEGTEGGVLVIDLNIRSQDFSAANGSGIQFRSLAGDSGKVGVAGSDDKDVDVKAASAVIDLEFDATDDDTANVTNLAAGIYRIVIALPENTEESTDNTLTAIFGHLNSGATAVENILDVVPVTIRDTSFEAPVVPTMPESSFDSVLITNNEFNSEADNPILHHNISNVLVTVGGEALEANFLDFFNNTGGVERWGYPSSELVEIESGTLTQFFQRGVIDFHDTGSGYIVERRLAWDYVGGHLGENDQGVEPVPDTAPEGGVQVGAFNHYVANVDADGNATGFLDFFNRLGGVDAFGYPKTEAREDTGDAGMLLAPGSDTGFTRQYFQAAVFQLNAEGGVELTLLGDELRNILVPGFADEPAFGQAEAASNGDALNPPVISS